MADTPQAAPTPAAAAVSLSVPAVSAPLGQPKGPDASAKLSGDAPATPRGPSEPTPNLPSADGIPEITPEKPVKAAAAELQKEAERSADEDVTVADSATASKARTEEGGSKAATVQAAVEEATSTAAASGQQHLNLFDHLVHCVAASIFQMTGLFAIRLAWMELPILVWGFVRRKWSV